MAATTRRPRRRRVGAQRRVGKTRSGSRARAARRGGRDIVEDRGPRPSTAQADGAVEQAGVEMGEAEDAAASRARERPLAGGGRAVDGDDHAGAPTSAVESRRAEAAHQALETGEAGGDHAERRRRVTGSVGGQAQDQEGHGDAVVHGWSRPGRRPRTARRRRATVRLPAPPRHATPLAASPPAIVARRSLSLTRSSPRPSHQGGALGEGAATARIGNSSIIEGARSGGTTTPRQPRSRRARSPTGSPPSIAAVRRW